MQHLRYLLPFFWKYRLRFFFGIICVGLANWFRVWQPQVIREAIDTVAESSDYYQKTGGIAAHPEAFKALSTQIAWFGIGVIALALMMGVAMFFMRQSIIVMSRLIEYDMRKQIFAHYTKLDTAFYKRNTTGDLMSRISEDVNKVRMFLGPTILYGLDLIFLFVLTIGSMLRVSPTLTMWSLLPLPFLSILIYWVSTVINRKSERIQKQLSVLTSTAQEVYSGIRVVKSYAQEDAMNRWFAAQSEEYRARSLSLIRVDSVFFPLMSLLIGTSIIITVYVGGLEVMAGRLTAGNIAEFVIYVNMMTWPVTAIGWIASLTQQAAASQKRINEFLKQEPTITPPVGGISLGVEMGSALQPTNGKLSEQGLSIVFEDVTFVYPDTGIKALDRVSFSLESGQKMAIVGRTGSGKTTIAELLVRMYDVTSGRILINGRDVREYDLYQLRQMIGYVPQDVFLFSDTVSANIAFGQAGLDRAQTEYYATNSAVHEEIIGLPQGYDTIVGERGVTLSGGQKQRVSIARAFAKQPHLVLLDDCLSAVDTTTEAQILGYLNEALADRTAIIITHRIYSSLEFDQIIVLEEHQVVASGTHDTLMNQGGYYAELFERQTTEA
jgi:ATP-binding cassette, subfamily B, multidrug efflux pump